MSTPLQTLIESGTKVWLGSVGLSDRRRVMKRLSSVCGVLASLIFVCLAAGRDQDQDAARKELDRMQGTWRVVSSQVGDEKAADEEVKKRNVTIKANKLTYDYGNGKDRPLEGTIKLDPKAKYLDWTVTAPEAGRTALAIYELKDDDLKIGFGNDGIIRPRRWAIGKDDVVWLLVLKREKP